MRLWKSLTVTSKDLAIFRKNKYIFYSLIAMPVLMGLILPASYLLLMQSGGITLDVLMMIINLTTSYFVVIAAVLPTIIASYSFVGEKVEKSLEPLLATPTTDGELLLGKSLAAFLPSMGATYIGAAIYLVVVDFWSYSNYGVFLLPNLEWAAINGLLAPLACILSVEVNVLISSRVSDVRAAQQLGGMVVLPIIIVMLLASTVQTMPLLTLSLVVSAALAIADVALFYLSKATFQREEILTRGR